VQAIALFSAITNVNALGHVFVHLVVEKILRDHQLICSQSYRFLPECRRTMLSVFITDRLRDPGT